MIAKLRALFRSDQPAGAATNRYVISTRSTGLGDRIICLGAAWVFARNTGRTLIADWRHSSYSIDPKHNVFSLCFEAPPDLAGVSFIGDDRIDRMRWPRPRHPERWNDDVLFAAPRLRPSEAIFADRDGAVALIRSGADVAAPTVVFDTCVNDGLVSVKDSRTFLGALRPVAHVTAMAAAFRAQCLGAGPVIGLHVRHGNGGRTGHYGYWQSFDAAIARCYRAVCIAREHVGQHGVVLLCTDSVDVEAALRRVIPDVVCRPKMFRSSGQGELQVWNQAHQVRDDALVEMLLLAGGEALIRYPPASFFTFYAAVMADWNSSLHDTVYDLQRPYDPSDLLSPVLLLRAR